MRTSTRTAALIAGAVVLLVAPVAAMKALDDPPDPRISVGVAGAATLLPGDLRDAGGRMVAGAVWTGLVSYDPASGTTTNAAAESITSPDRKVWTVRLRAGGRFHDGSAVTAASYAGAWTAVLRERWQGARLFTEVARVTGAGTGRLTGVRVLDERTLRVDLDRPLAGFPSLLGDPAFLPMPESVLRSRDWAGYGRLPIGNGPYRVTRHDPREITLTGPAGRTVVVRTIPEPARQYAAARAGDLDIATQVPSGRHTSMNADFRSRHMTVPGRGMTYLAIPQWTARLASPTLRQALSMAVDRTTLTEGVLGNQASPADSLVPPGIVLGHRTGQCRFCVHDARAATAALADAGGLTGPLTLWYDTGSGDEPWVRDVAAQLRTELKLDVRPGPLPPAEFRRALADKKIDGPFVLHSAAGYPSPVAALAPLLAAPTGHRDDYAAGLLAQADRAATPEDTVIPARLAESSLLRDLPLIPLWSEHDHLVWSSRVRGVTADPFGGLRLDRLTIGR